MEMFGKKGQAFDAFKLLIAAVVAGLILVIILGILNPFQRFGNPSEEMRTGIMNQRIAGTGATQPREVKFTTNMYILADGIADSANVNRGKVCFCTTKGAECPAGTLFNDTTKFDVTGTCGASDHAITAKTDQIGKVWVFHNTKDEYHIGFKP